jgi:hypothetical protein
MNIFVTSRSPTKSARYLDDERLVKMILESAQILCTALRLAGYKNKLPCRPTHTNHPCCVWARQTQGNFEWLARHYRALYLEYFRRYRRRHVYAISFPHYLVLLKGKGKFPQKPLTPFQNSARNLGLDLDFTSISSTTLAYRKYLKARWRLRLAEVDAGRKVRPIQCTVFFRNTVK